MKIKLLAVAVAGILLSGCNDDNGPLNSTAVQAFDPAVMNMTAKAVCADGTTETSKTDYYGNAKFFERTLQVSPETCSFTFIGGADAVDVSNGKSMDGVTYTIPVGLAQAGAPITASPLTTLIAKELNGAEYSEATATTVLTSLGLGSLLNNGVSVTELLSNTEAVLEKLTTAGSSDAGKLAATTAVLSDVLTADPTASAEALTTTASTLSVNVIAANPKYPAGGLDGTGADIFVTFDEDIVKAYVEAVNTGSALPTVPVATTPPAVVQPKPTVTGATGVTGSKSPS
ncbi:hypothetical protein PE36_18089 [Moritella sp. PE36]|uniref:hypothetical protein n=1 Tax=Moritella sp. PE36 TaxID=58051 RepID=UPI00015693EF|nr:hypothetical protein [Moritella sp. PE36]EDM65557.1 hypothetical protein PE36_18089 [Moritella sp. PE36]